MSDVAPSPHEQAPVDRMEAAQSPPPQEAPPLVESPPPAALPVERGFDPRQKLLELVGQLTRCYSRRLMVEYLRLRRAARL